MSERTLEYQQTGTKLAPALYYLWATVALWLLLFTPTGTPYALGSHEWFFAVNATRMLAGEVMYRDFHQFMLPGTELVFLPLLKLFGQRAWIPNGLTWVVGMGFMAAAHLLGRRLFRGNMAFLPGMLFLTSAFYVQIEANHHWFSALVICFAALVYSERDGNTALAGALCGVASLFTHIRGLLAVLAIATLIAQCKEMTGGSKVRALALLSVSFAAVVGICIAAFAASSGWRNFWESTVVFLTKYYPADTYENGLSIYLRERPTTAGSLTRLPLLLPWAVLHVVVPYCYVWSGIKLFRSRGNASEVRRTASLLAAVGIAMFLSIAYAPRWSRIAYVSLPAFILLAWCVGGIHRTKIRAAVTVALWICAIALAIAEPTYRNVHGSQVLTTPSGAVAFVDSVSFAKHKWLAERTTPGDSFFHGDAADIYYYLYLRNPTPVAGVSPTAYTREDQVEAVIRGLENSRAPFLLWTYSLDHYDDLDRVDPLDPLRGYVWSHYQLAATFGDGDEVWERNGCTSRPDGP